MYRLKRLFFTVIIAGALNLILFNIAQGSSSINSQPFSKNQDPIQSRDTSYSQTLILKSKTPLNDICHIDIQNGHLRNSAAGLGFKPYIECTELTDFLQIKSYIYSKKGNGWLLRDTNIVSKRPGRNLIDNGQLIICRGNKPTRWKIHSIGTVTFNGQTESREAQKINEVNCE